MSDDVLLAPAPERPVRRRSLLLPGIAVLALLAAVAWYRWGPSPAVEPINSSAPVITAESAELTRVRAELAALHSRLEDSAKVNRSLREQVLGLTQRVGLVEDGLSGLERGAAPGLDALRLVEADYLLRLGEQRLALFGDVAATRSAFELADAQLAQASDPGATAVRQTLALERDALAAIAVADLPVILARLGALADGVAHWSLKSSEGTEPAPGSEPPGWWTRLRASLDGYFRVRRLDPGEALRGGPLLRERIALDLARARMLLLRGEAPAALPLLDSLRRDIAANFAVSDARVARALATLDEVRVAPLVPNLPALGESRRELTRLRDQVAGRVSSAPSEPATSPPVSTEIPAVEPPPAEAPPAEAPPPETEPSSETPSDTGVGPGLTPAPTAMPTGTSALPGL